MHHRTTSGIFIYILQMNEGFIVGNEDVSAISTNIRGHVYDWNYGLIQV